MTKQEILCVRRSLLEERLNGLIPLGFTPDPTLVSALERAGNEIGEFRPRPVLEEDPTFFQLVVQGLVTREGKPLALFRAVREARSDQFVETRHNAKVSLSAGGHVEPVEAAAKNVLQSALLRELHEELVFTRPPQPADITPLGIICNAAPDAPLFHRVHIGVLYHVPISSDVSLPSASDEFDYIEFLNADGLRVYLPRMEEWGKLLAAAVLSGTLVLRAPARSPG